MSVKKIAVSKGGKIIINILPHTSDNTKTKTLHISSSTNIDILWTGEQQIGPSNYIDEPELYTENDQQLNTVLSAFSDINISVNNQQAYSYLHYALKAVDDEWSNPTYLIQSNFEELIPWHGNDSSKENIAHNAMREWMIALCLAELLPNKAENIYKSAYQNYNNDYNNDLYSTDDGFTIKGDINICRLVASVLWAVNRSKYNDSTLSSIRNEIGGDFIYGNWDDDNIIKGKINYNNIFPSAAGPYILDANLFESLAVQGERRPPVSQSSSLFYNNEEPMTKDYTSEFIYSPTTKNWTKYNYKKDVDIDDKITSDYNLDNSNSVYYKRAAQACADAEEDIAYYFSNKVYYKRSIKSHNELSAHTITDNVTNRPVTFTVYDKGNEVIFTEGTESDNDGYLEGPFNENVIGKDLSNCAYDGYKEAKSTHTRNGSTINGKTDLSHFLDTIGDIGSQSRKTLLNAQYGRRRPGQGQYNQSPKNADIYGSYCIAEHFRGGGNRYHPLAFMRNFSIESIIGGCATNYDINGNGVKFYYFDKSSPWDSYGSGDSPDLNDEPFFIATDLQGGAAHTYPSGHSARMFAIAISLIRLFPRKAANILKAAYSFTVSRNIVRAHWNSDIIYGRLIGAMTVPLAHANKQFLSEYSFAASYLGISSETQSENLTWTISKLTIINNTNKSFTIANNIVENYPLFYVKDGVSHNGIYFWPGGDAETYTIEANNTVTVNNVKIQYNAGDMNTLPDYTFETNKGNNVKMYKSTEHINIGDDYSIVINGNGGILANNGSYTITISDI